MNTPDNRPKELPKEVPILEEDFNDILEWTPYEEEEFLRMLDTDTTDKDIQ